MIKIRITILTFSILSTFSVLFSNSASASKIFYIPLVFGILYYILAPSGIKFGPGVFLMNCVMLIRYILFPIMYCFASSYNMNEQIFSDIETFAVVLYLYEMVAILFTWNIVNQILKKRENNLLLTPKFKTEYSHLITIIFVVFSAYFVIKSPLALERFNFIISDNEVLTKADLTLLQTGAARILIYTQKLLTISLFVVLYNIYIKTKKELIFYLLLTAVMYISMFYIDSSRNSLFIPAVTNWFLLLKLFPRKKKRISIFFSTILIFAVALLSYMKLFGTKDIIMTPPQTLDYWSININNYFGGIDGIITGLYNQDYIESLMTNKTLFNEMFGHVPVIKTFANTDDRVSEHFNTAILSGSKIIPTIVQGYLHFGFVFSVLFSVILIAFTTIFDFLFNKVKYIDIALIFGTAATQAGWMHQGNFVIFMTNLLLTIIPIYLILLINRLISGVFKKLF